MNLHDLLPDYMAETYPNQIVAVKHGYDGDFDCYPLESGKEFEFYKSVMYRQMDLWKNGQQIDTDGCSISIEESVLNFVDLPMRKRLVEYLAKDNCYWQARITGKNPHVKHFIDFKELGLTAT